MLDPKEQDQQFNMGAIGIALLAEQVEQQIIKGKLKHLKSVIYGCVGSPTFHADLNTAIAAKKYWDQVVQRATKAASVYQGVKELTLNVADEIIEQEAQVDYGDDPTGDILPRQMIAKGVNKLFGDQLGASEQDILFNVGATAGLGSIFNMINKFYPDSYIVTPFPYYWIYKGKNNNNNLHPIDVMEEPGYRVTAAALKKSLEAAKHENKNIGAILFCDPNNPLGTSISREEWEKIAEVLSDYNVPIVLDHCYLELNYQVPYVSLLEVAPHLRPRTITLLSGTKGYSLAGERISFMLVFNPQYRDYLKADLITSYIHAPRSLQAAYAEGFLKQTADERKILGKFYQLQSEFVYSHLLRIGLAMPDRTYKPRATFYVVADFSEFLGLNLPSAAIEFLGGRASPVVRSDLDICMYLLFTQGVALAPLSYFGVAEEKGWVRITCSNKSMILETMMTRIEQEIIRIRQQRIDALQCELKLLINSFTGLDSTIYEQKLSLIALREKSANKITAMELKAVYLAFKSLASDIQAGKPKGFWRSTAEPSPGDEFLDQPKAKL